MTQTQNPSQAGREIAEGDRIYATETIDYYDFKINAGAEGTVTCLNESGRYDLWIEWDTGFQAMADSGSVALAFDLKAWFAARGVKRDSDAMADLLDQYAGKTEREMDAIYETMHGSMA